MTTAVELLALHHRDEAAGRALRRPACGVNAPHVRLRSRLRILVELLQVVATQSLGLKRLEIPLLEPLAEVFVGFGLLDHILRPSTNVVEVWCLRSAHRHNPPVVRVTGSTSQSA